MLNGFISRWFRRVPNPARSDGPATLRFPREELDDHRRFFAWWYRSEQRNAQLRAELRDARSVAAGWSGEYTDAVAQLVAERENVAALKEEINVLLTRQPPALVPVEEDAVAKLPKITAKTKEGKPIQVLQMAARGPSGATVLVYAFTPNREDLAAVFTRLTWSHAAPLPATGVTGD